MNSLSLVGVVVVGGALCCEAGVPRGGCVMSDAHCVVLYL